MATAATATVLEVDELVEVGAIDPDDVHLPGLFGQRIVHVPTHRNTIEFRTTRPAGATATLTTAARQAEPST